MSDLDKFAKSHTKKGGPACYTCSLPGDLRLELRRGRKKQYSYTVLSEWLKTKGYSIMPGTIKQHFAVHE